MAKTETKEPTPQPLTVAEDPILTASEVAAMCGKNRQTIGNWVRDGLLKAVRMPSGMPGIRQSEVVKFLGASALPFNQPKNQ